MLRHTRTKRPREFTERSQLALVIILLLLHCFVRVYRITAQAAYVDEGFHSMLSTTIWKSGADPAHFQDGRILLYYYLSPFVAGGITALFISRAAIALFALISGAVVYRLGRSLHSHAAGVVALVLYSLLPFAFFHERMALADPLAAGFGCLVAWRSFVFARRPRWQDGLILGLLLALATLAKLTLAVLPLLPVIASIIYFPQLSRTPGDRVRWWLRHYFPPLALAAVVMAGCWLPVLIQVRTNQGRLVASMAVSEGVSTSAPGPLAYIEAVLHDTSEYTSVAFLVAAVVAAAYLLRKAMQAAFFLIFWIATSILVIFGIAAIVAPRYLLPAAAPLVLILAVALVDLWDRTRWRLAIRAGILATAAAWLIAFALPFLYTSMTDPANLPLTGRNYGYFLGGAFNADETTIQAAHLLDNADPLIRVDPAVKAVYGDWVVCRLIYFYMRRPVTCLLEPIYKQQLADFTRADLAPGESAYVIMNDTGAGLNGIEGLCPIPFVKYAHAGTYSLDIWRLQRAPCDTKSK